MVNYHNRVVQNGKPWQAHASDETLNSYGLTLQTLVQAVLWTLRPHLSQYRFPLTGVAQQAAEDLLRSLEDEEPMEVSVDTLHKLAFQFLAAQPGESADNNKWEDVLECYIAIAAMKEDGNFKQPKGLTQLFAKLKYLCRGTILYEAYRRGGNEGVTPAE
jgi:hypothetical protein